MTEVEPKPPSRADRLKNWALLIGAIATLAGSATALLSSLGVDDLIARKQADQTETTRKTYETLKASKEKLKEALRLAFERIRVLESQVKDLKENQRYTLWLRMAAEPHKASPPPPPKPEPVPAITSDPEALLGESGGLIKTIFGASKDEGLEILDEVTVPEWDQVQKVTP